MSLEPDPDVPLEGWYNNDIASPDYWPEQLACPLCIAAMLIIGGLMIFGGCFWLLWGLTHWTS